MIIQNGVSEQSSIFFYSGNQTADTPFFYPMSAGHFFCDSGYRVERSTLNSILAVYTVCGKLTFFANKKRQTVSAGETALIDCFHPHTYYADGLLEFYWVHISGSNIYQLYSLIAEKFGNTAVCDEESGMAVKALYYHHKNRTGITDAEMSEEIYAFLMGMFKTAGMAGQGAAEKAVNYISKHYGRKLSVAELAKEVHLSTSQFSRNFKKQTGVSPYDYILNLRIAKAKEYLKNTNLPISEIAFRTGFSDDSNFICLFRKKEGVSPLRFRKILF